MWCCIQCSSDEEKMQWGRKEFWKRAFDDSTFRMLKDPKTRCYNVLSGLLASVEKKESAFIACHFSKKQTESHSQECNPVQCQKNINRSVPRARFGNVVIAAEFTVIIHRACDTSILAYPLPSWPRFCTPRLRKSPSASAPPSGNQQSDDWCRKKKMIFSCKNLPITFRPMMRRFIF